MKTPLKIITITLNPAYDLHFLMKDFKLYRENYVSSVRREAGGKGINISRALAKQKIESTAYVILGKQNASDFESRLKADGLNFKALYCEGTIRENITIHTPNEPETRLSLEGVSFSDKTLEMISEELIKITDENTIVTFSGRIPKGLSQDKVERFLTGLKKSGSLLVVDCNSFSMESLGRIGPWLIKPNKQEIQELTGKKIDTIDQAMAAAKKIHEDTGIHHVTVSMGEEGGAMASRDLNCTVKVPRIIPVSTIGAGDSMLAGFIGAFSRGLNTEECFLNAVSFGTAACLTPGTAPPEPADIEKFLQQAAILRL